MPEEKKYYPAVAFHFKVKIDDIPDDDGDSRFQTVSGLSVELETESKKEGGENRFEHVLPLRMKSAALVLKRGLITSKSLRKWCLDNINAVSNLVSADPSKRIITPKNLTVSLLNEQHEEIVTWNVVHAWPKKWNISDLNAEQNAIAVETIELQYWYFTVKEK